MEFALNIRIVYLHRIKGEQAATKLWQAKKKIYYIMVNYLTLLLTGGGIMARIVFNAQSDPEGVKIAHWYFMTFPKYAQRPI